MLDERIERRVEAVRSDRDWPCRKGCDLCCRSLANPPRLSESEWRRIDAVLDDARRARARAHDDPRVCPFLEEGACSIYAVRPLACRTYGYYVEDGRGLWCDEIEQAVEAGRAEGVVFGNAAGLGEELGPVRPLDAWLAD
ncbi:MAG: YkgJ family cysteine cluster protein [Deltaproteobacteria bacterium]